MLKHRPDIDGLRAIAIVPVVLFHLDIEMMSGGFAGVDIFFVISGFLITSIIAGDIAQGRFSFTQFYERRVRRIFPALFGVLLASAIGGSLILLPLDFKSFGQSVMATSLFASNIFFWRQSSGYFDPAADMQPLLHTWSLAVEEQFYVLFPIFLLWGLRLLGSRAGVIKVLLAATLVSFALSVYGVANYPKAAFYLAPTRAWELLFGVLIALGAFPAFPTRSTAVLASVLGSGLIAGSLLMLTPQHSFPGLAALPVCLGAALIIHAGASHQTIIHRVLSLPALTGIGLISYSLYLWHWPLLVFAKHTRIDALTDHDRIAIFALSVALAVLSWKFIEQPFRGKRSQVPRGMLFSATGVAMAGCAAFGILAHVTQGLPQRLPADVRNLASASQSFDPRRSECLADELHWIDPAEACIYGASVAPKIAVWGDSHAGALMPGIDALAKHSGQAVRFYGYSGCPPVLGIQRVGVPINRCQQFNDAVIAALEADRGIETVILHARHAVYLYGRSTPLGPAERHATPVNVSDTTGLALSPNMLWKAYTAGIELAVKRLTDAGKRVVIVYPVPETGYDIPTVLAKLALQSSSTQDFTRPYSNFQQRNALITAALDQLGPSDRIIRVYPHQSLCNGSSCRCYAGGKPLYHDDNHLSVAGAELVAGLLSPIFTR